MNILFCFMVTGSTVLSAVPCLAHQGPPPQWIAALFARTNTDLKAINEGFNRATVPNDRLAPYFLSTVKTRYGVDYWLLTNVLGRAAMLNTNSVELVRQRQAIEELVSGLCSRPCINSSPMALFRLADFYADIPRVDYSQFMAKGIAELGPVPANGHDTVETLGKRQRNYFVLRREYSRRRNYSITCDLLRQNVATSIKNSAQDCSRRMTNDVDYARFRTQLRLHAKITQDEIDKWLPPREARKPLELDIRNHE